MFYKRHVPAPKLHVNSGQDSKERSVNPAQSSNRPSDPSPRSLKKQKLSTKSPERPPALSDAQDETTTSSSQRSDSAESIPEKASAPPEARYENQKHGLTPIPQPHQVEAAPQVSISSALPQWIRNPIIAPALAQVPFEHYGEEGSLCGKLISNLSKRGFTNANGLQSAVLPMLLPKHADHQSYSGDICISAATGSGKTLAYVLPMVEALRSKAVTRLRGLILVPTRELVNQAREMLEMCSAGTGVKIGMATGSRSLKDEQTLLIQKDQRWDPSASKTEQEKRLDDDEDLMYFDFGSLLGPQEDFECWPGHVLEYSSKVDILICTPGRLVEHIRSTKGFHLNHVQWLVIDEADRLLAESFQDWVDSVIPRLEHVEPPALREQNFYKSFHLPLERVVRKVILSATMTRDISRLMSLRLKQPRLVTLQGPSNTESIDGESMDTSIQGEKIKLPRMLEEVAVAVADVEDKPLYLLQLLNELWAAKAEERHNSTNGDVMTQDLAVSADSLEVETDCKSADHSSGKLPQEKAGTLPGILVFTNSNESALRLARLMTILCPGMQIRPLTKSSSVKEGRATLRKFRKGEFSVVVATDLASRGLDIADLADVINYDMPSSLKSYVHRVGRTARAGKRGMAMTLVEHRQAKWFWNSIGRAEDVSRAQKVDRDDRGLRSGEQERQEYELALRVLEQEATGANLERANEEKA